MTQHLSLTIIINL